MTVLSHSKTSAGVHRPYYAFALHPAYIIAFLVMLLNDHLLRPSLLFPAVAGKISDVAILIFLPAAGALVVLFPKYLVSLIVEKCTRGRVLISYRLTMPLVIASTLFSALVFILINTSGIVNNWYVFLINHLNVLKPLFPTLQSTLDPTDLITLPSLAIPFYLMRKYITTSKYS